MREIIVDNFAGGGGASTGIELATGRSVDIAINHDPAAIAMHKANHPDTKHYCESVWDVNPIEACNGHSVALAWFSPDCKHFSKAKGGKPCEKKIRGLAWIVIKWAALVRPRVIMLENVEEFQTWGPLNRRHYPIKSKKGDTFRKWKGQLESLGYEIETNELVACDYGAPTRRKRFFMIARCDGNPIIWPKITHGDRNSENVLKGLLKPYVPASDIIDWNVPCTSIFGRKKPLAENTLKRIARGLQKFVIENPDPFIMQIGHTGFTKDRNKSIHDPLTTIVSKAEHCLITPTLIQYHSETTKDSVRGQSLRDPIMTIDSSPRYGLASAFVSKYYGGTYEGAGSKCEDPLHTVTGKDHNALVTAHIIQMNKDMLGTDIEEPINTIVAGAGHMGVVSAFISKNYAGVSRSVASGIDDCIHTITARPCHSLVEISLDQCNNNSTEVEEFLEKYYGKAVFGQRAKSEDESFIIKYYGQGTGQDIKEPLDTVVSKDRFGLVTIQGQDYKIIDIGLRMLEPKELFAAQGFPDDYIIDKDYNGKSYPKTAQVARCGNAVPPPFANALVRSNLPEQCTGTRVPNMRIDSSQSQLRFA